MDRIIVLLGIVLILVLLYLYSSDRKKIKVSIVIKGLIVQFILALILVKIPLGRIVISRASDIVTQILSYGNAGLEFVFGSLGIITGPTGYIFAIQVLASIVFTSTLIATLYYLGILGFIIKIIGKIIGKILGTSKVETFVAVANMFLGHTDCPILINKYLPTITRSETMVVLVSGMGSMAANVMLGYSAMGIPMEYLLIASSLVPIGSIVVSKIICPETEKEIDVEELEINNKGKNENLIDAITEGAMVGMECAMAIGASLIAVIGLVALINAGLGWIGNFVGITSLSLEKILSYIFAPFGFFMGLKGDEIFLAGELLGCKVVLNEFVAFQKLGEVLSSLDTRTGMLLSISLAGFANFSSIGMCLASFSALCPEKRGLYSQIVFKSMVGGFIVNLLNAFIIGLII